MNTNRILIGRVAAVALFTALAGYLTTARAAGSLTPPGAPAPMMKTLQEMEPRTLIASLPYTISTSGSYYLSNSLAVSGGNGITIQAYGVTLDLNGCNVFSSAASPNGDAILINGSYKDITIFNGHIVEGMAQSGGGSGSGSGFAYGIYGPNASNVRVYNVSVLGVLYHGIDLNANSSVVHECAVNTAGSYGIYAGVVESCSASNCGGIGIYAVSVSDSYGYSTNDIGIYASVADNCYGYSGTTNSYGIYGYNLNNCYGYGGAAGVYAFDTASGCYGGSGYGNGVSANTAENCYGESYASGTYAYPFAGVTATVANNCYGYSYNSSYYTYGIDAKAAHNCYGQAYYGIGCNVYPGTAENCYGTSTYYYGIYANAANNCYGDSQNYDGMDATTANNCYGDSQNSDGMDATTANNCYGISHNGVWGIYTGLANNCEGVCDATSGTSGYGLDAYQSAQNCYGYCSQNSGVGLSSYIAIGCYGVEYGASSIGLSATIGESSHGLGTTPLSVTHNLNCY